MCLCGSVRLALLAVGLRTTGLRTAGLMTIHRGILPPQQQWDIGCALIMFALSQGFQYARVLPSDLLTPGSCRRQSVAGNEKYATKGQRDVLGAVFSRDGCHSCGMAPSINRQTHPWFILVGRTASFLCALLSQICHELKHAVTGCFDTLCWVLRSTSLLIHSPLKFWPREHLGCRQKQWKHDSRPPASSEGFL